MDEKKVREAIYCMKSFADDAVCEECDNYDRCDYTMAADNARTAIEALKKQLPEKVRLKQQRFSQACKCPNCGNTMIFKDETSYFCGARHKFCPDCGQRLDWSEE